jgi:polysaccharide export outer membrane protein
MKIRSVSLRMLVLAVGAVSGLAACSSNPAPTANTASNPAGAGNGSSGSASKATLASLESSNPAASSNYRIGREDVLVIDVFQVPDLSRTVEVDSNGRVLLPLIGQIKAVDQTPDQLSAAIANALSAKYVNDPQVTVSVKESQSERVTVEGAVVQPGIYPIVTSTTLMKAIALAHGPDMKLANLDKVAIFRSTDGKRSTELYNYQDIRDGKIADPQVVADDIIVVDTSGIRRFLQDISPIAPWAALGGVL